LNDVRQLIIVKVGADCEKGFQLLQERRLTLLVLDAHHAVQLSLCWRSPISPWKKIVVR
jgi:hypothetical protein